MASQNTPSVRDLLKSAGLLAVREAMLLRSCRSLLTYSQTDQLGIVFSSDLLNGAFVNFLHFHTFAPDIITRMPFDSVASLRSFRESAACYLVALFNGQTIPQSTVDVGRGGPSITLNNDANTEAASLSTHVESAELMPSHPLQIALVELFRQQFTAHEALLTYFAKLVRDPYVLHFVFPHIEIDLSALAYGGCLPSFAASPMPSHSLVTVSALVTPRGPLSVAESAEAEETLQRMMHAFSGSSAEFVAWYRGPLQRMRRANIAR